MHNATVKLDVCSLCGREHVFSRYSCANFVYLRKLVIIDVWTFV